MNRHFPLSPVKTPSRKLCMTLLPETSPRLFALAQKAASCEEKKQKLADKLLTVAEQVVGEPRDALLQKIAATDKRAEAAMVWRRCGAELQTQTQRHFTAMKHSGFHVGSKTRKMEAHDQLKADNQCFKLHPVKLEFSRELFELSLETMIPSLAKVSGACPPMPSKTPDATCALPPNAPAAHVASQVESRTESRRSSPVYSCVSFLDRSSCEHVLVDREIPDRFITGPCQGLQMRGERLSGLGAVPASDEAAGGARRE